MHDGKTLSSVTYYTDQGEINFDIPDTYVPVKTGVSATVDNIKVTDAEVKVELSEALPSDYSKKYAVDDVEAATTETGVKVTKSYTWNTYSDNFRCKWKICSCQRYFYSNNRYCNGFL